MNKYNIPGFKQLQNFQESIVKRIAWPYSEDQDSIFRWRAKILFVILSIGILLGVLTVIFAAELILKEKLWSLAIIDLGAIAFGLILLFVPRIRFEIRASILCLLSYVVGITVIVNLGPLSGGPIWLFSFAILSAVLIGDRAAFAAIVMNTVSLIVIGLLIHAGKFGNSFPLFNTPQAMVVAGANFFLLNIIVTASVSVLVKGLNQSQNRYRFITDNIADVIWTIDMDLKLTYISPSVYQQSGYTDYDLIGKDLARILRPESYEKTLELLAEKLDLINRKDPAGWAPAVFETQLHSKDGSVIWARTNARVLTGQNKNPRSILGVSVNITERKKSEERLQQSEEKFRAVFKTSPNSITLTEIENGIYTEINDAHTELTGYTPEELIGRSTIELNIWNNPKDREAVVAKLKKEGIVESYEAEFRDKHGQVTTGLMSARTLEIKGKTYLLSATQDITELKKNENERLNLESRLQHAQKMESIGTLAGGIAHDFNNILFPMIGYAELLMEDLPEDSEFRDSLNEIYACALKGRDLVKQILTFSRKQNSKLEMVNLQTVVDDVLKLLRSSIPSSISINQNLQAGCGLIKANPTQVHQIVMNLATNACHAMQNTGGELEINLKEVQSGEAELTGLDLKPGKYALLSVADNGSGMTDEVIKKIFDPFFTTKETGKGTGMGLSIVHGIVSNMNGLIKVDSEPDKGAEFKVYLPVEKDLFSSDNRITETSIPHGTERILLIDDEESVLMMEEKMLLRLGYRVTSYAVSSEALEAFCSAPDQFDLVITDMTMPKISGDKLSSQILTIRPDIPILICTGFSETMSEENAARLGIKGLLMKPIVMAGFSQKIREVLDQKN